jgi:hypothetical protein
LVTKNLDLDPGDAPKNPGSTFSRPENPELEFVYLLRSPGIDSQPGEIDSVESIPGLWVTHPLYLASLEVTHKLTDFSASNLTRLNATARIIGHCLTKLQKQLPGNGTFFILGPDEERKELRS